LGEHLLCKQGVNGSIPFSSTITPRRILIHCFQIASRLHSGELLASPLEEQREPIWKQVKSDPRIWPTGFSTAQGRAVRETDETVWMFDNEIDWVIAHRALVPRTGRREAAGRTFVAMTRIQGRAHCRAADAQASAANASVQCKKSVFRSVTRIGNSNRA